MSGPDERARNRLRKNGIHAFPEKAFWSKGKRLWGLRGCGSCLLDKSNRSVGV